MIAFRECIPVSSSTASPMTAIHIVIDRSWDLVQCLRGGKIWSIRPIQSLWTVFPYSIVAGGWLGNYRKSDSLERYRSVIVSYTEKLESGVGRFWVERKTTVRGEFSSFAGVETVRRWIWEWPYAPQDCSSRLLNCSHDSRICFRHMIFCWRYSHLPCRQESLGTTMGTISAILYVVVERRMWAQVPVLPVEYSQSSTVFWGVFFRKKEKFYGSPASVEIRANH